MLLCEPVEQMRSSVYVSEVCVCTRPIEGECKTEQLQPPVCFTSGEIPAG